MSAGAETLVVRAEITEMARVANWSDAFAARMHMPQSILFAIQLCLEEAVSNVVRYGFADGPGGTGVNQDVTLTLERQGGAVILTVNDFGLAFDPLETAIPVKSSTIEEAAIGGNGILLMRQFAQHLHYERRDGMNRLTLRFDLPEAAE